MKEKEGQNADLWQQIEKEVLHPIGVYHYPVTRTKERKGKLGVPIMGFNSFPNVDETAKIALLLQNEGRHNDRQLLNRNKVREALNRTSWPGAEATEGRRYQHSIWLKSDLKVGNCTFSLSSMEGWGGHFVSFYPNDIIVIRFTDAVNTDLNHMASAVGEIRNLCDQ